MGVDDLPPPGSVREPLEGLGTRIGLGLLHVHQAIYEVTDGRLGHRLLGLPCLLLRTTGSRTGKGRTASLVYARDGGDYLVVGSLGGADQAPGWLHNVRARPHVGVQVARDRFDAVATVVERGDDDHGRLWRLVNENSGGRYDRYQARTSRPIPVVRLSCLVVIAFVRSRPPARAGASRRRGHGRRGGQGADAVGRGTMAP